MIKIGKKDSFEKKFTELKKYSSGCWVRVVNPDEKIIKMLSKKYSIDREIIDEMLDEESVPKIEKEIKEGYISIILRVPKYYSEKGVVTIPLGLIFLLKKNVVLTICKSDDPPTRRLFENSPIGFRTDKKSIFFSNLINFILATYMKQLRRIEFDIKDAEHSIKRSLENKEIVRLLSFQKTLVYFRTSMIGNKKVVNKISLGRVFSLNEENHELLEDVLIDIDEAQQLISIYDEIIKNTIDAYSSIVSNNLNSVMKLLALITIALSIPTMIGSFYGMNVPLPFQGEINSFFLIIIISLIISIITIGFFRLKKWM
jgi:magnesium transporter